jgi:sugar lactone lactonase YvrE
MRGDQATRSIHSTAPAARLHLLALSLAGAALLSVFVASAQAAEVHPLITSIKNGRNPTGIAINESNGNVFVAYGQETEKVKISGPEGGPPAGELAKTEFTSHFEYSQATMAFDNSATSPSKGALYVADPGLHRVNKYVLNGTTKEYEYSCRINGEGSGCTPSGNPTSAQFGETVFIALDSKGNLFVSERSGFIYKFGPQGEDLGTIPVELQGTIRRPESIAVNSDGDLYVRVKESGSEDGVYVYEANGSGEIEPGTTPVQFAPDARAVAIDPSNDHVYLLEEEAGRVAEYSPSGTLEGRFGKEVLGLNLFGLAVNGQNGNVYVSNQGSGESVVVFGPSVLVPDAATGEATDETRTSATLSGTVSAADGPAATCVFQYVNDAGFKAERFKGASSAPCSPAGPFTGDDEEAVSAELSGLEVGTTYHYRLLASNENGSNSETGEPTFQTLPAVNLASGKASGVTPTEATLNGTVNPEGIAVESCSFEYGVFDKGNPTTYGQTIPCVETLGQIGTGTSPVPVHADLAGLTTNTDYHFRLVASNSFGTTRGADSRFASFGVPRIKEESISQITPSSAVVSGLVNPDGATSAYFVEYVSEADFAESEWAEATTVPPGGVAIDAGTEYVDATVTLDDLAPFTTYHARLVAVNSFGPPVNGSDLIFTTYGAEGAGLPDGRAYEQVTPVDKNGANAAGAMNLVHASPSGNGVTYASGGGIPGTEGSQQYPTYLAARTAGWSSQGLLPPASAGSSAAVLGWGDDLAQTYVVQADRPGDPLSFLQRESATLAMRALAAEADVDISDAYSYTGSSADGSAVVFESSVALLEGASTKGFNTYVWDGAGGELKLAGVFNNGSAPFKGSAAGSNNNPNGYSKHYTQAEHAVSVDGSRIFFSELSLGQLYVRMNPTQPQSAMSGEECTETALACTAHVSASQRAVPDPKGKKPSVFVGATPDGEHAFFTSQGKLTDDATTGPDDKGNDLYRYDVGTGELTDLSPDSEPGDPNGAEVRGVLGISDDGSYVYFVANGVLAPGATPGNCTETGGLGAGSGSCSLYLWHDGVTTFIARLRQSQSGDNLNWATASGFGERTSRLSADGETLLFRSGEKLTDYDNQGTPQFYRYSAPDAELSCVTCNPTGAAPVGPPTLQSIETSTTVPGPAAILTRSLSADGRRVFFETPDKLVATDTNGDAGCAKRVNVYTCQDVYEWEAKGTGSCQGEAQNGGCIHLLSTGTSPEPSYFGDAGLDGDDAFIFTGQPLVGQDQDQLIDIYDARVGGGIASQNPPPPPVPCEGEACKGPVPVVPASESPGSASFAGPGNQKTTRGKQKKRQRKKKQTKQKKQHHKKRHAARKHG